MIKVIAIYELKNWVRQYSVYFYGLFLMLLGASAMLIGGDILGEKTPDPEGNIWANSPLAIHGNVINQLNILIFFLIPAIYGAAINRDYKSKMHMILYSYPIRSTDYFFAKYLSASIVAISIVLCLGIGMAIGENIPGLDAHFIGPFKPVAYFAIYSVFVIPNVLIFGAIVYTIVSVTRNIYTGYVVILVLILFRSLIGGTLGTIDYAWLAASLDPYAGMAGMFYSGEWSLVEKNRNMIPIRGVVIYNRLFWLFIAVLFVRWGKSRLLLLHHKYHQQTPEASLQEITALTSAKESTYDISTTIIDVSTWQQIKISFSLAIFQFKTIASSKSFIAIAIGTYVLMFILLGQVNPDLTTQLRPFTQVVLQIPTLFYTFLLSLLTYVYAGYLVHRLRSSHMDQIVDSTPISNSSMIVAHLLTITFIQITLVSSILVVGMTLQLYSGETPIDLGQYTLQLYGITLITLVIWTTLSLLVHTTFPNLYLGVFLLIIGSIGIGGLGDLGIKLDVLKFNSAPYPEFSDLTGHKNLYAYFVHKSFWLFGGVVLLMLAYLLWYRGTEYSLKSRLEMAKNRASTKFVFLLGTLVVGFFSFGNWIYNETVQPTALMEQAFLEEHKAKLELLLEKNIKIPQPSQTGIFVGLDIFPNKRAYSVSATSTYINKSKQPIKNVWINSKGEKLEDYNLDRQYSVSFEDSMLNVILLTLDRPLETGDSLMFMFDYNVVPQSSLKSNLPILSGGTYLMPDFPDLDFPDFRLTDSSRRADFGLKELEEIEFFPNDSSANTMSYVGKDLMNYEAIVSTVDLEMAITSGDLVGEWEENGRNYYQYKSNGKIRNGFVFHSGAYDILEEDYKGVHLSIYHHPDHTHNNQSMMKSMKATLDYCQSNFSEYHGASLKIVEFPRVFGNFAQSFAGLISYSEQAGFLINVDTLSKKRWDSPFRLTAHEMSHQWWGHQVVPSRASGSKFVTEGLAEYTAAKLLEKEFGMEKLKRLIWISRERYFRARNGLKHEHPLMTVPPEQGIVAYHKGCLALLTLADYLGEDVLNMALMNFIKAVRMNTSSYPTSLDLIGAIKSVTPDSLLYMVDDLTKEVIVYDNQLKSATFFLNDENKYEVNLEIEITKYHGNRERDQRFLDEANQKLIYPSAEGESDIYSLPLNDYVKVVVYGKKEGGIDKILYKKNILFTDIHTELLMEVDEQPTSVEIDPLSLLLDRNLEDNRIEF